MEAESTPPNKKIKNRTAKIQLYDAIDELKYFPECANVKKLKSSDNYRLRVGNWRVIFNETFTILYIEEVKKRNERTYKRTNN